MLKVPSSQTDVKHDTTLEMPGQAVSERRQRPRSSISSRLSFRPPEVDLEQFQPKAFFCLKRESKPRIWFIKLMSWPWFEHISILVILVNCVTLGMYNPFDMSCVTERCKVLETLETAIYAFFLVEMLIKWIAMGLFGKQGYFEDSWNKLDCFIVAAGSFELAYGEGEYLSAVRSIRVLRPLRAINRVPSIRILVQLLLDTLPMLGNVLAICFFIFAIFGIISVQLWQGLLRSRCFPDQLNQTIINEYNLSSFYRPSFDKPDYVCSLPDNNGLSKCDKSQFEHQDFENPKSNHSFDSLPKNTSSYWYQYYTTCRDSGENIYWGSISFDNIGIATVAIFQIITLEGWTDIMYKIQDAHSFWNWIYFVVLILLGSYFMTNLCLVVITSQFQETKQRETESLRLSLLRRSRTSVSTVSSSLMQQGCYTQILNYLEHLCRRLKRRVKSRLKIEQTSKRRRVRPCMQLKNRKDNVKSVHHHHHHHHYYHHYVHHHPCPCSSEISDSPPVSSEPAVSAEMPSSMSPPLADHALGVTQDTQDPRNTKEGKRILVVPQIQVITQAATTLYKDTNGSCSSGEMVSTATANINVQGQDSSASVVTYSKSADAVSVAAQATAQTIETVCSCAAHQSGEDGNHVFWKDCKDSADSSEDNKENSEAKKSCCHRFRDNTKILVEGTRFTRVIMVSIFLNTVCMAVEHHGQPEKMTDALEIFNIIFTTIFALEMLLKIIAFGPYGYIKDAYNLFDGVIVIVSLMDILAVNDTSGISVLRSFRLLRIFKLVRFMPALQRQLSVMIKTLDNVMTFLALLALFIFTSSILGMHLFGGKYQFPDEDGKMVTSRANFDTLFWALVTVFQVLTQEDWNVVLYDGMRSLSSWAALYFIFLMIIGNYILFNLLVAILVEGFADHTENERLSAKSDKDPAISLFLSPKPRPKHKSQPDPELALSWPNLNTMLQDESSVVNQLPRCRSAPGRQELSDKPQRSTSYLHVLTVDALESEHSAEETGNKCERARCASPEDEDSSLVPLHSKTTCRNNSVAKNKRCSCLKGRADWSLYVFSPDNGFRKLMEKIHEHVWFDRVVLFFILFNCLVMALEEPGLDKNSKKGQFIRIMQYIFTAIFTVEMSIKVISLGLIIGPKAYLKCGWNIIDGVLVLFSLVDLVISLTTDTDGGILGVLRVFRAFRTLRPLRVINRAPELKLVVQTLLTSLKPIGNVVLIAATFFTIFGILGVQLFKGKFYSCHDVVSTIEVKNKSDCLSNNGNWLNNEYNFDNLARALLTLFVFATRDGWVSIMYSGVDAVDVDKQPQRDYSKWNVLYFVAFLLLAGFVVLNMLVGIVVENFHKCRNKLLEEHNAQKTKSNEAESQSRRNSISGIDYEEFPPWRRNMFLLVTHDYFDLGIAVVIGINVLCMAMEHYNQPENLTLFLKYANYLFTILFIFEAILKILALGLKNYFRNKWNCLDMMIVILSIGGIILDELATSDFPMNPTIIRVMRVLRITRVLKLLKTAEGIRSLLDTVGKALPQVANLGMLFLLLFFIFGALGMELFGKISCDKVECEGLDTHAHFRNFGYAVLTLFRVSTGDNWNGILKDTIDSKRCDTGEIDGCEIIQHIAPIYFAAFVLITQFVLLNVVVAVMMKHLEESKTEESLVKKHSERKIVEKHSPTTPRLFLGKRTPDLPGRSKNSPRLLKASQQSLRSRKSESGILKNKESLNVDGSQRRAKSMEEIRNNNACLSYNSGSDSDCCFDDLSLGKDVKVSADLRKRKPSTDNSNKNTDFNGNSCTDAEISRKSVKSKNSNPVLEIVDVENNMAFSEPYVKSSGTTAKELIPLVKVTEPVGDTSDASVKSSERQVKKPLPFEVNQDDENEQKNDEAKKDVAQRKDRPTKNEGRNRTSSRNMSHLESTDSKEKIGKGKQDKVLKEDEGKKQADKKTEISKEIDQADKKLKKTIEEKKKKGLKVEKKLDSEEQEKRVEEQSDVRQETETEVNKSNDLEEKIKCQDNNKEKLQDVRQRGIRDDRADEKDNQNELLGSQNLQERKPLNNVKEFLAETTDRERSSKQTNDHKKPPFKELVKDKQSARQHSDTEIKSQKGMGTQEGKGLKVESQLDLMDNRSEQQDSEKDLLGTNEGSRVNPMDNTLGVNQGSQRNLMDSHNRGQNSPEEISNSQPEGNARIRFHGMRLEPLPDNVNKLTPPASNI